MADTARAAQAMRKAGDIAWKPAIYLNNVSSSVASTMKPAGFDNVQGVITARLDALPRPEKELIQEAAVHGKVFWLGGVGLLCQLEAEAPVRQILVESLPGFAEE